MSYPFSFSNLLNLLFTSVHLRKIVSQFSQAIVTAIHPSHLCHKDLIQALEDLTEIKNLPSQLTEAVYGWCSVVCENYSSLAHGVILLLLCLEVGFRHLDPKTSKIEAKFTHMNHQMMADIVFRSGDAEAIADLLHAWFSQTKSSCPPTFLEACAQRLTSLHNISSSPSRLRQSVIRSIGFIGYHAFEQVGVEGFFELLKTLQVGIEDVGNRREWGWLLLDTVKAVYGIQHLPHPYWELLVELALSLGALQDNCTYSPHIMASLEAAKEWDKLECWMCVVWMVWTPEYGRTTVEELEPMTLLLFHQRPGAIQKLRQWMERQSRESGERIFKSFQQICEFPHVEAAQHDILQVSFCDI
jgi:hypothetical protein